MTSSRKGILSALVTSTALMLITLSLSASAEQHPALQLENCHLKGIKQQVHCGTLEVPENYQKPDGSKISINFAILPAIDNSEQLEPLMFLAGGPGQAAVDLAPMIKQMFKETRKKRDVIMVDQRGTGKSAPLECPDIEMPDIYSLLPEALDLEEIKSCIAQFKGDLSQFNSENAIRDFDAVRAALGHEKINLYGGSYGTRAALVYMRLFPQNLRSVVLDSVGPIEVPIGLFGQSGDRAFKLMLANCKADEVCNKAYPNLAQEYQQLSQRLADTPLSLEIVHPRLGSKTEFKLSKAKLNNYLRLQLYSPSTHSMMPLIIHQAYNENYAPLIGLIATTADGLGIYEGVLFNIVCNEDMPRVNPQMYADDAANDFDGDATGSVFKQTCAVWPKYSVSDAFYQPVTAAIPTLILSGDLDPVTPPSNGDHPAKTLPNSHHIIDKNSAHIVAGSICGGLMINEFLTTLSPKTVDTSCLKDTPKPSFVPSINGGTAL